MLGWESQDLPASPPMGTNSQQRRKPTCGWTCEDDDGLAQRTVPATSYDSQLLCCVRLSIVNKASRGDVLQAVTTEFMIMVAVWLGEQYGIRATDP